MGSNDNLKTLNFNYHNITVTIFVRVVIYRKELPPVKSLGPLITWSCNFEHKRLSRHRLLVICIIIIIIWQIYNFNLKLVIVSKAMPTRGVFRTLSNMMELFGWSCIVDVSHGPKCASAHALLPAN